MKRSVQRQGARRGAKRDRHAAGDDQAWTCPGCDAALASSYCPSCGESRPRPRDLTLRGLLDQAVDALVSIDSRLLRSLRT